MKTFLVSLVAALVFGLGSGFGTAFYQNEQFNKNFLQMTGVSWQTFEEGYANCVLGSGELCNLYGGFAPLSKFRKPQGTSL